MCNIIHIYIYTYVDIDIDILVFPDNGYVPLYKPNKLPFFTLDDTTLCFLFFVLHYITFTRITLRAALLGNT